MGNRSTVAAFTTVIARPHNNRITYRYVASNASVVNIVEIPAAPQPTRMNTGNGY